MIQKYTPNEISKIKAALPEDLKQALASVDMMQELRTIVFEQKLHVDEAGAVADAVELTLSGILRVREFIQTLREILPEANNEKIIVLAEAINKRIFAKVRASLQKIDQDKRENPSEGVLVNDVPIKPAVPPPSGGATAEIPAVKPLYRPEPTPSVAPTPTAPMPIIAPRLVVPPPPPAVPAVKSLENTAVPPLDSGVTAPGTVIHEQKMVAPVNVQPTTTDISHVVMDPRVKLVPEDVKQRINSDPYKEPIT